MRRFLDNSFEHIDWENRNCCECAKYSEDASKCDLMQHIGAFAFGMPIEPEIERRIGCDPETGRAPERCGEFEEETAE